MDICSLYNLEIVLMAMITVFLLDMNKTTTFLLILSIFETFDASKDTSHIMPKIQNILMEYPSQI